MKKKGEKTRKRIGVIKNKKKITSRLFFYFLLGVAGFWRKFYRSNFLPKLEKKEKNK
jgi:hypothetical protein